MDKSYEILIKYKLNSSYESYVYSSICQSCVSLKLKNARGN